VGQNTIPIFAPTLHIGPGGSTIRVGHLDAGNVLFRGETWIVVAINAALRVLWIWNGWLFLVRRLESQNLRLELRDLVPDHTTFHSSFQFLFRGLEAPPACLVLFAN
jgi:hypothetical protein